MKKEGHLGHLLTVILASYWAIEASCQFIFQYKNPYLIYFNFLVSSFMLYGLFFHIRQIKYQAVNQHKHKSLITPYFFFLLLGSLPYDGLSFFSSSSLGLVGLLKVLRLVSLYGVYKELTLLPESIRPIRLALIMLAAFIGIHFITIGWLAINPAPQLTPTQAYIKAVYWAITTLTTTGYGDITPTNDLGRIFTIFTMLTGFSMFGIIVGNISNLLMAKNKRLEENKQKLEELSSFMGHYEIPRDLRREVFQFYSHRLNRKVSENENKIISELPQGLQTELQVYMKMKLISSLPVFDGLSKECVKKVALSLESVSFSAGQVVLKKGDWANEMFIIDHGEVAVLNDENVPVATLKHGQCFGEIALLMEIQRTKNVIATSYCDFYSFKKEDFLSISKIHPELKENFHKIMDRRIHNKAA